MKKTKGILGVILSAITLVTIIIITTTIGLSPILLLSIQQQQSTEAKVEAGGEKNRTVAAAADIAVSADNIYVVWWSNKTTSSSTTGEGDWEVFFRASTDGGKTWGDKMNLSNSKGIVSNNAQVAAEAQGKNVYVTWWESNENVNPYTNEPVMRISIDEGKTFGPILKLDSNSVIGSSSSQG